MAPATMGAELIVKLCECGCGQPAPIARQTDRRRGYIKGQATRFIQGHSGGIPTPAIGTRREHPDGYVLIYQPDHLRADRKGFVLEHVLVAENALGHALPEDAVVHHVNKHQADNRPVNLVICEDVSYHQLLHRRMDARLILATGEKACPRCKVVKPLDEFYEDARWFTGRSSWCKACCRIATKARRNHEDRIFR